MKRMTFHVLIAALLSVSAAYAADEITLPSARLPGELISLSGGKVIFETPFGRLEVPLSEVRGLVMESDKEILVGDATPFTGRITVAADGTFDLAGKRFRISDLKSIAPPAPPEQPVTEASRWSGSLAAAVVITDGNSNTAYGSVEASVLRDHMKKQDDFKYRISLNGKYFASENAGAATRNAGSAGLLADVLFTPELGAFLSCAWSFDYFAGVHARTVFGAGLTMVISNTNDLKFSVGLGASWVGVYYNRWSLDAARAAGGDPAGFIEYPGLLLQAEFVWQTPLDFEYGFSAALNKSALDPDNYDLAGETWISRKISRGWFIKISAGYSRTEPPAPGKMPSDSVLTIALMFKF